VFSVLYFSFASTPLRPLSLLSITGHPSPLFLLTVSLTPRFSILRTAETHNIESEIKLLRHCDHINVLGLAEAYQVDTEELENTFFLVSEIMTIMTVMSDYSGLEQVCVYRLIAWTI
jgi:hypothetical protein